MSNIKHPAAVVSHVQAIDYNVLLHKSASGFVNGIVYDHIDAVELQQSIVPPSPFDKS
jgi:hypothetical protein